MSAMLTRNWLAKLIVFAALALTLRGFAARIVDPIAAATGSTAAPAAVLAIELVLIALYILGLFAFPNRFWRRAFKFVCLMGAYMLLGRPLAAGLTSMGLGGAPESSAVGQIVGHVLALLAGYFAYKLAWPRLEPHQPDYNPAA